MSTRPHSAHQPPAHAAPSIPGDVARRAVEWLLELQDVTADESTHKAWGRWHAAHPDHARAWQRIESVNERLRGVSSPVQATLAHATLTPHGTARRRLAVKTLSVMFFTASSAWVAQDQLPWRVWTADHRTAVGERRTLLLDDETVLVLNTDTALDVRFNPVERLVRLVAGEVLITTGSGEKTSVPPFVLDTGSGRVKALGTRFHVRQLAHEVAVNVFDGAVEVTPRHGRQPGQLIRAGQSTRFTVHEVLAPWRADDDSLAWTDGFIVAQGMSLGALLAELGRYSPHPLACDPSVADRKVSGSYPVGDVAKVLDTLAVSLSLKVETVTRLWGQRMLRLSALPPK